ncbi:MAG: FRG domain-containing protein, partial [Gammaproteobacteria bacterium]|nr:FRG domain-containing protein [Gammaproteobacteria bacterium]
MKDYRVRNFIELHQVLSLHRRESGWLYRGHADLDWPLIPRAGRAPVADQSDEQHFRLWQRYAGHFENLDDADDWAWLAHAQHHGLATRLLDWSSQPLAAAWFAVFEPGEGDSV